MAKISVTIPADNLTESEKNELVKFKQLYPASECAENPFISIEAVGYLKHIKEDFPALSDYINHLITALSLVATELMLKEIN